MFRNDRNFYHRKSDASQKSIITIYSPDKPYTVYDKAEWWGDTWDPLDYGVDFDFSRTFSEQWQEMRLKTPRANLFQSNTENSVYTNHALNMKNSYLIWGGGDDEDCLYGNFITYCKDMVDGLSIFSSERCYEGIASERCYDCIEFNNCRDCTECIMVEDCMSCSKCIGCFGLYRKRYCLFNKQLTKDEWEKHREELGCLNANKTALLRQKMSEIKAKVPHRGSHIFASENCTGDSIFNSKNCEQCFDITQCEDCKYVSFTPKGISTYDAIFTAPEGLELSYNVCSSLGGQRMLFTFLAYYCSDTYYSMECHHCNNLFGCASMRNNSFCIFNKQYSKEEYESLAGRIIEHMIETGEWGEYFPPLLAPICYNESNAIDYFPITKDEAVRQNWSWHDEEELVLEGEKLQKIPESIAEVNDSICDLVLTCKTSSKQYKIIPQELKFYKEMNIALPKKWPIERHNDRMKLRLPRKLWSRICDKCNKEHKTNYSPKRPETVYCEECYLKEVY
tara:strand:- start:179 stop:1699 length:1521 start_codon:yes stop_codon:yes gene_type:complete